MKRDMIESKIHQPTEKINLSLELSLSKLLILPICMKYEFLALGVSNHGQIEVESRKKYFK